MLNINFTDGVPRPWEVQTAQELYEEKYRKTEWIFPEQAACSDVFSRYKAAKGVINVSLSFRGGRIEDIRLSGGFILHPGNAVQEIERALRGEALDEETLRNRIHELFAEKRVQPVGVSAEDFARAIMLAYLDHSPCNDPKMSGNFSGL